MDAISNILNDFPDNTFDVEFSTEDLSFEKGFFERIEELEEKETIVDNLAFEPKKHSRKEHILKEPLVTLEALTSQANADHSQTLGVPGIIDQAGNVLRSRIIPPSRSKRFSRNFCAWKNAVESVELYL